MLTSCFTPFLPPYILSDTFCPVTTSSLPRIAMTAVLVSGWLDVSVPCSVKQIHQGDTIHHRNNISYNNTNRFIKELQYIIGTIFHTIIQTDSSRRYNTLYIGTIFYTIIQSDTSRRYN